MTKPPNAWKRMQNRYGWPFGPIRTAACVIAGMAFIYAAILVITTLIVTVEGFGR